MTDLAATSANATEPAAAPAAAVVDDDAPLPPLDRDAEMAEQIDRAKVVAGREERKAKKAEQRKAKAKPAESTEPGEPTEAAEVDAEPDEPAGPSKSAKELFEEGDLDGALKAAFGVDSKAFKLDSKHWAQWRKADTAAKREIASMKSDVQAREQKLTAAVERIRSQAAPLLAAREAWEQGNVTEAVKHAFGVDFDEFNKRGLREFHGKANKDPEAAAARREVAELRAELQRREQAQLEQATEAERARALQKYTSGMQADLAASQDAEIAALARKPGFISQVLQVQQQHWDARTQTTLPLAQAAEMVRDAIRREWGDVYAPRNRSASESPNRAGSKPERQPTATLSTRGATEASPPGRALTDEEMYAKYTALAKAANG